MQVGVKSMIGDGKKFERALDGVDESKRKAIARLATGGAFLAPIVAVFAMQGLTIRPAMAANSTIVP
jgi:hypothetical protein